MPTPRLTLYTKPGCHLCEQVEAHLLALRAEWERCDITLDPGLYERYKHAIPVLAIDGREVWRVSRAPIDRKTLRAALRNDLPGE